MFQKIAKHRANDASNDVHRPPLRAVEPTGSSLQLLLGIVIGNYHLQLAIVLTNKTILITGWNWSCLETFLLFTTMATAGNWPFAISNIS